MKTTEIANDILQKALQYDPDQILTIISTIAEPMVKGEQWSLADVKRVQKQVFEVVRARNNLAIILHHIDIVDPRQFEMFGDLKPGDFE